MPEYFSPSPAWSEEDKKITVDLLYETVLEKFAVGKPLPTSVELMRIVRNDFKTGLLEAKRCVERMEDEYKSDLQSMAYFPHQRKKLEETSGSVV